MFVSETFRLAKKNEIGMSVIS